MAGNQLQKRLPLPPQREAALRNRLVNLQGQVERKIARCEARGDKKKATLKKTKLWAIIAINEHNYECGQVKIIKERYQRLGIVPSGFHYPEFY